MTDIIGRVEDKATLAEMETLAFIAGESAKKVTHFLMMGKTTQVDQAMSDTYKGANVSLTKTIRAEDTPQTTHNGCENSPESGRAITQHTKTAARYATTKQERPVFIPTSSDWFYLGSRDTPLARQVEAIQRPAGTYIGPFNDKVTPMKNITNQSEDHNCRWRKEDPHCTEEAVFKRNRPKPRAKDKHDTYINKQHRPDKLIECQISKKADGHRIINNMNNSSRIRFQTRHLPTWIPIRDIPDEEPQRPPRQGPNMKIARGPPSDRIVPTPLAGDVVVRRMTVAHEPTRQTPGI